MYRVVTREEKNYLNSCKDIVDLNMKIKAVEGRKRKAEQNLEEAEGQLKMLKMQYNNLEKRNIRLKEAYQRKLKFSPAKVQSKVDRNNQVVNDKPICLPAKQNKHPVLDDIDSDEELRLLDLSEIEKTERDK